MFSGDDSSNPVLSLNIHNSFLKLDEIKTSINTPGARPISVASCQLWSVETHAVGWKTKTFLDSAYDMLYVAKSYKRIIQISKYSTGVIQQMLTITSN